MPGVKQEQKRAKQDENYRKTSAVRGEDLLCPVLLTLVGVQAQRELSVGLESEIQAGKSIKEKSLEKLKPGPKVQVAGVTLLPS